MINLTEDERTTVERFIRRGKANARNITRAHILLRGCPKRLNIGKDGVT